MHPCEIVTILTIMSEVMYGIGFDKHDSQNTVLSS